MGFTFLIHAMERTISVFSDEFLAALQAQGYSSLKVCGASGLCGVKRYNFTWGLTVNLDPVGYERRYCYEARADASTSLAEWSGDGHPSGPWIKCKGGGIDLLNPAFGCELKSA